MDNYKQITDCIYEISHIDSAVDSTSGRITKKFIIICRGQIQFEILIEMPILGFPCTYSGLYSRGLKYSNIEVLEEIIIYEIKKLNQLLEIM